MEENKILINLDSVGYDSKPVGKQIGSLSNRIRKSLVEITPRELAHKLGSGHTMVQGAWNNSFDDFISSQLIAIDFDNTYPKGHELAGQRFLESDTDKRYEYQSIKKVLSDNEFTLGSASFIYKTFSYTTGHEKFRLVFILNHCITDVEDYKALYSKIASLYPSADTKVGQPNRLMFGGAYGFQEIDFNNRLKVEDFLTDWRPQPSSLPSLGGQELNYQLIKQNRPQELGKRLPKELKGNTFSDRMSAMTFFNKLNMPQLLGLKAKETFFSIIRNESNASASIYQVEDLEVWLYRDFGEDRNYDIISLIQCLLPKESTPTGFRKASRTTALNFMLEATESKIELNEKLKDIQEQVEDFKSILLSGTLKEQHPAVYQVYGRYGYVDTVNTILDIFKMHIYDSGEEGLNLTWLSVDTLARKLQCSKTKVNQLLKIMTLTNIIELMDNKKIPVKLLEMIEKNQTHYKDSAGNWQKRKTKRERKSNVYQITLSDTEEKEFFEGLEERCDVLVQKGLSMKGLSREWVIRTLGKTEADRVYPQDATKKPVKEAQNFTEVASKIALNAIKDQGYILINDLKSAIKAELKLTTSMTDFRWKQVEQEFIESYDLTKTNLNNALKAQFKITHLTPHQRPAILMQ